MCHIDLRREAAAAVIAAKPASALLKDTVVWYLVGEWACVCDGPRDAMVHKHFRLSNSTCACSQIDEFFRLDGRVGSLSRKGWR